MTSYAKWLEHHKYDLLYDFVVLDFLTFIDFQLREKKLEPSLLLFSNLRSGMLGEALSSVIGVSLALEVDVGEDTVSSSEERCCA